MSDGIGSHKLRSIDEVKEFVFAGRATFTLVNSLTGNRLTFRFSKPKDKLDDDASPIFASVMGGRDNETSYNFVGTVFDSHDMSKVSYRHGRRSKLLADSVASKTIEWLVNHIKIGLIPTNVEVWHEGRCGRCNKLLTVPESIENGLGPVCIKVRA
jgi:hypothetical protein